eukprot:CAMPEP_0172484242 /NCGR_PEP_ID=MMETSP1066-20121228/11617_1 /TAXON_ID=671091 /ORGANISM="Coscinodiscus wailesii, Strain CCMP2513" /LENGTH=57 /DNA_ID=CAMNT_0013248609 /DNA_START=153 /DNA_END=326 /DNA_ORIENTATION=-
MIDFQDSWFGVADLSCIQLSMIDTGTMTQESMASEVDDYNNESSLGNGRTISVLEKV